MVETGAGNQLQRVQQILVQILESSKSATDSRNQRMTTKTYGSAIFRLSFSYPYSNSYEKLFCRNFPCIFLVLYLEISRPQYFTFLPF